MTTATTTTTDTANGAAASATTSAMTPDELHAYNFARSTRRIWPDYPAAFNAMIDGRPHGADWWVAMPPDVRRYVTRAFELGYAK